MPLIRNILESWHKIEYPLCKIIDSKTNLPVRMIEFGKQDLKANFASIVINPALSGLHFLNKVFLCKSYLFK